MALTCINKKIKSWVFSKEFTDLFLVFFCFIKLKSIEGLNSFFSFCINIEFMLLLHEFIDRI